MRAALFLLGLAWMSVPAIADDYHDSIRAWQKERDQILRRPDGWLSLAGFYWLTPGVNAFGAAKTNQLVFPRGPAQLGRFELQGETLSCHAAPGQTLTLNGQPFAGGSLDLQAREGSQVLGHDDLLFFPLRRDGRWALRLKDRRSPIVAQFRGMSYFPVAPKWKLEARFVPFPTPRKMPSPTVMGTVEEDHCPGEVVIDHAGKSHRLLAIGQPNSTHCYLNFADTTNGKTTYGGGRYLDFEIEGEKAVLDFNRAYTPPCAFTHFATCSLVPPQNRLNFAVEAGEKKALGVGELHVDAAVALMSPFQQGWEHLTDFGVDRIAE